MRWFQLAVLTLMPLALLACGGEQTSRAPDAESPPQTAAKATVAEATPPAEEPSAPAVQEAPQPANAPLAIADPPQPEPASPPVREALPDTAVETVPLWAGVLTMDNDDPAFGLVADDPDPETGFADNAFPPTLSDTDWHRDGWEVNDCLRCHETGVEDSPPIRHRGMPEILVAAKCRSCHVLIPGEHPDDEILSIEEEEDHFADFAFPPMIPNSPDHLNAWTIDDCMRCHEDGTQDAPIVEHKSEHLPKLLLKVKCRTCHVQVRAIDANTEQ
ncbi:MAG: multiheme c-type cytochrome [Phycisphaerales bacterium JB038]